MDEADIKIAIKKYEDLALKAEKKGAFGPAIQAINEKRKLEVELFKLKAMNDACEEPVSGTASKHSTLKAVRRIRASAEVDKSYIALTNILKQEEELVKEIVLEEGALTIEMTDGEIIQNIVTTIEGLPEVIKVQILARLK